MGRSRCEIWTNRPRTLEGQKWAAHKRKGIGSSHKHSELFSQNRRSGFPFGGKISHCCVPEKGWGQNPQLKSVSSAFPEMVHPEKDQFGNTPGEKCRGPGRWAQPLGPGQGGLYHGQKFVLPFAKMVQRTCQADSRHVCFPRKSPVGQICVKASPLAGMGGRCFKLPPAKFPALLCKHPLENNRQVVASLKGKQTYHLHDDNSLLGFKFMVAPTSETARKGVPRNSGPPLSGHVQQLLGRINASAQVAPDLHSVIRKSLESKQISSEAVDRFLKQLKSIQRYDRAFKLFWAFCVQRHLDVVSASLSQVAGHLLEFNKLMPSQARHAYSSLLLIPGLEQLTFSPLLRQSRRIGIIPRPGMVPFTMPPHCWKSSLVSLWTG